MTSGRCGKNLTWTLDDDGTLTISGCGKMENYLFTYYDPFDSSRELIRKVVLEVGLSTIGDWAFIDCKSLTSVIIPDSVTFIGFWAFFECKSLTEIKIPDGVTYIGQEAFIWCRKLKEIHYPSGRGFENILSQGNNAKLIPYTVEPPAQFKPSAETNCTVYRNTKISRAENIAPPNAKSLSRVDENIAEIRRAANSPQ